MQQREPDYQAQPAPDDQHPHRVTARAQWAAAAPRRPRWKTPLIAAIAAAAGVAIAAVALTRHSPSTPAVAAQVHVKGTLTLNSGYLDNATGFNAETNGDPCAGGQGFSDISQGVAVTVGNQTGATIGVGALSDGAVRDVQTTGSVTIGTCVFSFDVPVPGGQGAYTVTISHRGTQTYTPDQVAAGIALTLG